MNGWCKEQKANKVTFLPDGSGDFTRGMGMLVKDGVIEKMFTEPDQPGDPFEISDADTLLAYIAPGADKPLNVTVFSREGRAHCARAKGMLRDAGIDFEELVLNRDFSESTIRAISGETTVPPEGA